MKKCSKCGKDVLQVNINGWCVFCVTGVPKATKPTQGRWVNGWGGGITGGNCPTEKIFCANKWPYTVVSQDRQCIAIIPDSQDNMALGKPSNPKQDGTMEANAQLIASAPELLKACKYVLSDEAKLSDGRISAEGIIKLARAINKAEDNF